MELASKSINGNFGFFVYRDFKCDIVPLNINMEIINGILIFDEKYLDLVKYTFESYPSYIIDEKNTLKLYKIIGENFNHNVFTSILFVLSVAQPNELNKLSKLFSNQLGIVDISMINFNFYSKFNDSKLSRYLVILETKIYFWWRNFNQLGTDSNIFKFYLWCFKNLSNINTPILPGSKIDRHICYPEIFNQIENTNTLNGQFKLRYSF